MAFRITEVHELDTNLCHARVDHHGQSLTITIQAPIGRVSELEELFVAELDYRSVAKSEAGLAKDDERSGIYPTDDDAVVIADGSVSGLLPIADDHVLVDLYIRTGPEFVSLNSEELGGVVPEVGSRLRVWLRGLQIHPTLT